MTGETTWLVPPLSLPKGLPSLERLIEYDAIRLFVERARSIQPSFALTEGNAAPVAEICHRLDGLPLAIELAAARVKALSVEQIAQRLDDRFRLLTEGSRTTLPRHQTLKATIDWSYELLSEQEQVLLRRLSVFAGGWTLEAGEAICAGEGLEGLEVLDLLTHLVDKSLVVMEPSGAESRYRVLETVRQYARAKLLEAAETEAVRNRHLDWYLKFGEKAELELRGKDQRIWLERLEREHDNLRAALRWSLEGGQAETGLQLAGALGFFWYVRGYSNEGRRWLENLLATSYGTSVSVRAKALIWAVAQMFTRGDSAAARPLAEESLALWRGLGEKSGIAHALRWLGLVARDEFNYERATILLEESLALFRELGDKWGIAVVLGPVGGLVASHRGDYGRATALLQESLALRQELQDAWGIAQALIYLGNVARDQGDNERAIALLEKSLTLLRELGERKDSIGALLMLAHVARDQHQYERASALLEKVLAVTRETGDKWSTATALALTGLVALDQGDYEQSMALYRESLPLAQEVGNKPAIAMCLEGLAGVAEAHDQSEQAARLYGAAEALRDTIGTAQVLADRVVVRANYARNAAAVRAALSEEAFAKAWAEGRAMTLEQAIEVALEA